MFPWPPVILILLLVTGLVVSKAFPFSPPAGSVVWLRAFGAAVCAAGLGLDLWAIMTMYRHRTNVLPHRAADRLVTTGPFRFSRNPIYLGNTVLLAGIAVALANPFFLLAAILNVLFVSKLAIEREEAHLESCFAAEWRAYAARVPRWIGPARRS